jgi:Ca2+-binding EF-hand superfamily protein
MLAFPAVLRIGGPLAACFLFVLAAPSNRLAADDWDPLPILQRLDRDENGYVTRAEIPPDMRQFVAGIASQARLDAASPLKLQTVRERWPHRVADFAGASAAISGTDMLSPLEAVTRARMLMQTYDLNGDGRLQRGEWQRLSPAWGEDDFNADETLSLFEMSMALWKIEYAEPDKQRGGRRAAVPSDAASLVSAAAASAEAQPSPQPPLEINTGQLDPMEQRRMYASELLRLYDIDGDNVLKRNEWDRLGSSWQTADSNHDGRLTIDEMTIQFQSLQEGRLTDRADAVPPATARKLPDLPDLPEEFHSADRNGDGQVQMHEFADRWDEAVVRHFQRLDVDGDGVITPREWQATERD